MYIDDSLGFNYKDDLLYYVPYEKEFPHLQTLLL